MRKTFFPYSISALVILISCQTAPSADPVTESLEYQSWESTQQPEGSAVYLGLGTYAKCLCTAVFESGRDPEEAFSNSTGLTLEEEYIPLANYEIDRLNLTATVSIGDTVSRTATYVGDQGCILDVHKGLHFTPVEVTSSLPAAENMDWPMGDVTAPVPEIYPQELLRQAADAAFEPRAITAAFLVIHRGEIIIERYREDITKDTQLESWSMGKSVTATLVGRLIQMGKLSLDQKAPVPEWQEEGDPRGEITIRNLLQMSGGLRFPSYGRTGQNSVAGSASYDAPTPMARLTHIYVYTGSIDVFDFAVNRPLEFVPGSVGSGQYRNSDPLTLGYILRNIVEAEGRNYWTWPQEELFDKIGIRRQLLETDRYGNFIMTGYDYGTARNWGRLALLYLQHGMWEGERLLPEGFVDFVSTPAESWEDPIYGGLFWINTNKTYPLPETAYAMRGGGGQNTIIVPSLELIVVRMGHARGADYVSESLNRAMEIVVQILEAAE
jgi:CubicO group peptidase (beta-lactamase class C family)